MVRWALAEIVEAVRGELLEGSASTGIHGISTDTRNVKHGELFVALKGERYDGHDFIREAVAKGAGAVMVSDSSAVAEQPVAIVLVPDTLSALQALARSHRLKFGIPVIGITGSCGKTTVKELMAAVLGAKFRVAKTPLNFNNEIGVPLSLLGIAGDTEVAVIELGTNAPGEMSFLCDIVQPNRGLITNVGRAHLEGFGTVEAVAEEKGALARALGEGGTFYVNADDPFCMRVAEGFRGRCVTFGEGVAAQWRIVVGELGTEASNSPFALEPLGSFSVPLLAKHNVINAAAAAAVGADFGLSRDEIQAGLLKVELPPMRMKVFTKSGRVFMNDAYNANPESMRAAIGTLVAWRSPGRKVAVLGDMLELGAASASEHRELGTFVAESAVDLVMVLGQFAQDVAEGASDGGLGREAVRVCSDHAGVARILLELSAPGDVILVKGSRGVAMEKILEEFDRAWV